MTIINLNCNEKISDEECDLLKGKYLDDNSYDTLVTEDTDCFRPDGSILFKFRKHLLDKNECELGFLAFKGLAKSTRGRGASAGQIDPNSVYWKKRKIVEIASGGWSANYEVNGKKSKMKVQNEVASNAIGFWSETNNLGLNYPCRQTHYTRQEFLKVEDGQFVLQKISSSYKNLHPDWYEKQMKQASINPKMKIADTPFSTITINRNFRTAVHKDAGDFGFGNLSVLEYGHYHGGYFVLPKYRIAIDMRAGDHLCVDVHEYHGNTELYETDEDKIKNDSLPDIFKDNLEVGTLGLNNRFARVSLVCYLRNKLKDCKMELNPALLNPEQPPESKIRVFFVNKLEDSVKRQAYYNTNWSRVSSHEEGLHRIIKHRLSNIVLIDDDQRLVKNLGNSKKYNKDGITFLNVAKLETKGIYNLETKVEGGLAYLIPNWKIALSILSAQVSVKKYFISPNIFTSV